MTLLKSSRKPTRADVTRGVLLGLGLVAGGVVGFFIAQGEDSGLFDLASLSKGEMVSLVIAIALILNGLVVTAISFNGALAKRALDPAGDGRLVPGQIGFYRQQAAVQVLAGLLLAAPVITVFFQPEPPEVLSLAVMIAVVALFLVQTALNLTVWSKADEMMRRMIAESGTICFWVLQGALFLWAAAEKLGLAPALSTWDLLTALMAFYLIVSSVLSVRRGFA